MFQRIKNNEVYQGQRLRGSLDGFCPVCNLALPLQIVVVDDRIDSQSVTNRCSRCDVAVMAYTRNKSTGEIMSRWMHPKLQAALDNHSQEMMEYLKAHPAKAGELIGVPREQENDLLNPDELID